MRDPGAVGERLGEQSRMKIEKIERIEYNINLSEEEASYLKSMLQNYSGISSDEPEYESNIRKHLFIALRDAGVKEYV